MPKGQVMKTHIKTESGSVVHR